jgi:DNA-binding NarL/FixJ family response regulator
MVDGGDELQVQGATPGLRGLVERIELHIKDLDVVSDEIRKIQELISDFMNSGEQRLAGGNLGEATDRLEKRVRKWILQLGDEYRVMRTEVLRFGNDEEADSSASAILPSADSRTILLLDDRTLVRRGLKKILEGRPGFRIIGEASDPDAVECVLGDAQIDLLIAHVSPQNLNEIGQISSIKRHCPPLKVLILTGRGEGDFFSHLVRSGADGYLLDDCNDEKLFYAIEKVLKGETYLSPAISESLLDGWRREENPREKASLTRREEEILKLVAEGKSSKGIADRLFISAHTVDRHRANIMAKLNMRKVTDLVKYAISRGLVASDGGGQL